MKKFLLALLTLVLFITAKSQVTGGGQSETPAAPVNSPKNMGLYLKFGLASPSGDAKTANYKSGYIAEFGFLTDFDRKKRKVSGGMIIGDDFAWYKHEYGPGTPTSETLSFLGIKVGPALHIKPVDKMVISAYYAIHGGWALGKFNGTEMTEVNMSFMNTFGFNLKYKPFIIGLEFDSGKMNLSGDTSLDFPTTRFTFGFSM
jgi:hypothetical protein